MKRKPGSRQGAVLLTVIIVSMMMMVIISAAIAFVGHTNKTTHIEYRKKQAYFTAASCLEGFVEVTTNYTSALGYDAAQIEQSIKDMQQMADGNEYTIDIKKNGNRAGSYAGEVKDYFPRGVGDCTIKLEKINGSNNNLKATATATYAGETQTVAAYLYITPLHDPQPMTNALEIIGEDGGGQGYNNIRVYGNTAASDTSSHDNNTLYKTTTNVNGFYGDKVILGSLASTMTRYTVTENPCYTAGVDNGQNPGCTLTVSRSLAVGNRFSMDSSIPKDITVTDASTFNYLNVGEGLILGGVSSTKIGNSDNHQVDVYASGIVFGTLSSAPAAFQNAVTASVPAAQKSDYTSSMQGERGQEQTIYGNIYTYNDVAGLNGDIYINDINNKVYGDIYCGGDIYFNVSAGQFTCTGSLYISDATHIHGNKPAGLNCVYGDWANNNDRCARPAINCTSGSVDPYVYYPEHFLCQDGVSNIRQTYASFYKNDNKTLRDSGGYMFIANSEVIAMKYLGNAYNDCKQNVTYTAANGKSINANYYVDQSCVLTNLDNATVLIDARKDHAKKNADGRQDIVIVMKDGMSCSNGNKIFVINDTDESDDDNEIFVYFVSDSGVGTTTDNYSADGSVSQYDTTTFKRPTINFGATQQFIMDADTYLNSSLAGGGAINPTDADITGAYKLKHNQIMMLLTEGTTFTTSNNGQLLLQAAIYGPAATVSLQNTCDITIEPYVGAAEGPSNNKIAVLGMVICHNLLASNNNEAIFYQAASDNSMLPKAKGSKDTYDTGFDIDHYAIS